MLDNLLDEDDKRLKFNFCNINDVIQDGKYVIDKHTNGIDTKALYTNGDYLYTYIIERFGADWRAFRKKNFSKTVKCKKPNFLSNAL